MSTQDESTELTTMSSTGEQAEEEMTEMTEMTEVETMAEEEGVSSNSRTSPVTVKRSIKRSVFPKKEAGYKLGSEVSGSTLSKAMKKAFKEKLEESKQVTVELSQGNEIKVDATLSEDLKKQKMDEYKFKLQERKRIRAMREQFEEEMPELVDSWDSSTERNFFIQLDRVPFLLTEEDVQEVWKEYVIRQGKDGESNQKMGMETMKTVLYDMLFWCYSNIPWFTDLRDEFFESMREDHSQAEMEMLFHVNIFHGAIQKANVEALATEMMQQMGGLNPQEPIVTRMEFEALFAKAAEKVLGQVIGVIPQKAMDNSEQMQKAEKNFANSEEEKNGDGKGVGENRV